MANSQNLDTQSTPRHEPPTTTGTALGIPLLALRRRSEPDQRCDIGPPSKEVLAALQRVSAERKSEALLLWPQPIEGIAVFHALAAFSRITNCDDERLATLFFPWNRNSAATQRTILADREQLAKDTLPPLTRVLPKGPRHPAFGYLMALHSLKHLTTGKDSTRRKKALERDPSLMHPTLLEIMPQAPVRKFNPPSYEDHFLQRMRRHTWINERIDYIKAAGDPLRTPFFLFGVPPDMAYTALAANGALDPKRGARCPNLILVDLTRRARNTLGTNWRQAVTSFLDTAGQLYGSNCPPVLALTDDVFVLQALKWKIVNHYDVRRGIALSAKHPAASRLIFSTNSSPLDSGVLAPSSFAEITAAVYGSEILNFADDGLKLRRSLLDAGDTETAHAVTAAIGVLQNIVALPGLPDQFYNFLSDNYEGYERQSLSTRFDQLAPRGKIALALKLGLAGAHHAHLSAFLQDYDKLCAAARTHNPGSLLFDNCLRDLAQNPTKSLLVFSSELLRAFAEWRIENDESLAAVRTKLGQGILLADRREAIEDLDSRRQDPERFQQIVFVEPHPEDFLRMIARPCLPPKIIVLSHLARSDQLLRRIEAMLQLDGVEPLKENLLAVQKEFERALAGRRVHLPDLDAALLPPHLATLDLTANTPPGSGPTRVIRTSGDVEIRAFDGTELAVYDPEALQGFSRRLAEHVQQGDQICVFSPEFVDAAREKLNVSANAPEVLALYHKTVAEAAAKLAGHDMTAKATTLRQLILNIDPSLSLSLPGPQSLRQWIDVADLVDRPRDEVRPQAPRDRRHYMCFMKALGISEDVARHYWDWGIVWTRSIRISRGSEFHQFFMGILIDPHGAAAQLPDARQHEVWRIYETAEHHVVTVISNEPEGVTNESR